MKRRSFLKTVVGFVPGVAVAGRIAYPNQSSNESPGTPPEGIDGKDFLVLARELAKEKRTVVGVFRDPVFAGREVPASLHPEDFQKTWGRRDDIRVVFLDKEQIRSYSILFKGRMDILVYPYGPLYPMDSFSLFSGDTITHFLKRGGAVLTTGGVPFGLPVSDEGQPPVKDATETDGLSLKNEIYERWVAPFGYKYYVHPFQPTETRFDRRYFPGLQGPLDVGGCRLGLVANNSSHEPVPKCSHGNVFPERYPARQVTPLFWGSDKYGKVLAVNGLLIQDFENGSRRIHLAHEADPHPLSPNAQHFSGLMVDLLSLLTNQLMLKEVETDYACYRQGESIRVRAQLVSFEADDTEAEVALEIRANGQIVDSHSETLRLPAKQTATKEWHWAPQAFDADEYEVVVAIRRHGQVVCSADNGFVIWNPNVVQRGPALNIQGKYFRVGESESFLSGTNYYESTRGEIMWFRPNVKRIAMDLRQMRECGVNYIRPHFHHLKWFKDYLLFQHGKLFPFFVSLEGVENPLPDERVWRIWDAFIYLCQKLGIVYGGDLFTLVPEEMGDPRGWFPLLESVYCQEKRSLEREFLRQINLRFKAAPGIAWDLWNEPGVPVDALKGWTNDMRQTLEQTGVPRYITVGGGSGEKLGDAVDYVGAHSGTHEIRNVVNTSKKPVMMQEIYMDHNEDLPSELIQAEDMREGILATLKNGYCGVAPWSWTRQMRLWQDSYEHDPAFRMESWDDRLGTQVHDDATLKPAGQVFRDLATLIRTIHLVDFDTSSGRISTDRGELIVKLKDAGNSQGYSLYHVSGDRCFAVMSLASARWGGQQLVSGPPSGYVYVFTGDGSDLLTAKRIYAKSEAPGKLVILGRSDRPRSVSLVDVSPLGNKALGTLSLSSGAEGIEITVDPTSQAYWAQVDW
jgi:hypothetical protein